MNNLIYNIKSGKNVKAFYFAKCVLRNMLPASLFSSRRSSILKNVEKRNDFDYIMSRVDYYNKLTEISPIGSDAIPVKSLHKSERGSTYFYDTCEIARYFDSKALIRTEWGDVTHIPETPSIVKSRPIEGGNANSVVLKLDKIRHFIYVDDPVKWDEKKPIVYFRGKIPGKEKRERFFNMFFGNPLCDLGDSSRNGNPAWKVPKSTIREHLNYKYILALEGNDVASNLKWVMSSNSIAVMPKPEFETWFMEGKLVPNVHYLEVKHDYSDLEERIAYCEANPEYAKQIIKNANEYVRQFRNSRRELLISLLTLQKYLKLTNK